MGELSTRLNRIKELSKNLDSILLFNLERGNDPDYFYFTNTKAGGVFHYDFSRPRIFTVKMELERAKKSWANKIVTIEKVEDIFSNIKKERIGIDAQHISAGFLNI